MEGVATGFRDHTGSRPARFTVFRRSIGGQNTEFVYGIRGRPQSETTIHAVDVRDTVEQIIVRFGWLTIHGISLPAAQNATGLDQPGSKRSNARLQAPELGKIAANE